MEYLKLNNNVKMPVEGLGTFLMGPAEAEAASLAALEAGYEHIDTANAYMNESRRLLMRCMVRFERRCRWVACSAVFARGRCACGPACSYDVVPCIDGFINLPSAPHNLAEVT